MIIMSNGKEVGETTPIEFTGIAKSMLDCVYITHFRYYINKVKLALGDTKNKIMLEVGGVNPNPKDYENDFGLKYNNIDLDTHGSIYTIKGDITDCPQIKDNTYDFIYSTDTFEHIAEPWKAAKEMIRILKPGGIIFIIVPFAYRYHPVPIDYWRYTPQCLEFLFRPLKCLEANWDSRNRRGPVQGIEEFDKVPVDDMGTFRENWRCYYIGRKEND